MQPLIPQNIPPELLKGKDSNLIHMRIRSYLMSLVQPWQAGTYKLLSVGKDKKTKKGEKYGVRTGVLYLAPANWSGTEVCPRRTRGCSASCLFTSGHGTYANVKEARLRKTMVYLYQRERFDEQLNIDIEKLVRLSRKNNMLPAVRLNGTSDIDWINHEFSGHSNIFSKFRHVSFYDYTKRTDIAKASLDIPNYYVTFSRAETLNNHLDVAEMLELGINVTVVFKDELPPIYEGKPVINGDHHDIRFWDRLKSDGKAIVIGLKAKGKARYDKTGFVVLA